MKLFNFETTEALPTLFARKLLIKSITRTHGRNGLIWTVNWNRLSIALVCGKNARERGREGGAKGEKEYTCGVGLVEG